MNLPNNPQLEGQFIGQCLVERRLVTPDLSTADFYNPNHRAAWSAILDLTDKQQEIEPFAIVRFANGANLTVPELMQLTHGLVIADDMRPHVADLKTLARRRYLMRELSSHLDTLQQTGETDGVIESLEIICERFRTGTVETGFQSLADVIDTEVKPALDELVKGQTKKIATGFSGLDHAIGGGITLSDVILVVSDTGAGKSAFVLQLADQIAKQGLGVAFVSGEMRNRENGLRLLSQNTNTINLNSVVRISSSESDLLHEWADAIKGRPIFFDHNSGDLQTVKSHLRKLIKQQNIKVLVLDYIQLYRLTRNDKFGRVERLTEVSQEVKRIANEFGICVIEVAQFNRQGAKSDRPTMHDLEGSGQLEKDTSLIFIIDRTENSENIELRIVKGRNSGLCTLQGRFEGRTLRFEL